MVSVYKLDCICDVIFQNLSKSPLYLLKPMKNSDKTGKYTKNQFSIKSILINLFNLSKYICRN